MEAPIQTLSFGQIEACLSTVMGIADDKRATFVSRLKQWQKMGFPHVDKVGRGARTEYRLEHLMQLAVMMQLLRLGLTPDRAIGYVRRTWPNLLNAIIETFDCLSQELPPITYAIVHLNALAELMGSGPVDIMDTAAADVIRDSELAALWYGIDDADTVEGVAKEIKERGYSSEAWQELLRAHLSCSIVIEMDRLCIGVMLGLGKLPNVSLDSFRSEFDGWRAMHEVWIEGAGQVEEQRDLEILRRDTDRETWRVATAGFAAAAARSITGKVAQSVSEDGHDTEA